MFAHSDDTLVLSGLVAASLLMAAPVHSALAQSAFTQADPDREVQTRVISTRGLDLASASDQALLRTRIARAAREVCGLYDDGIQRALSDAALDCTRQAITDASSALGVLIAQAKTHPTRPATMVAEAAAPSPTSP